VNFVLVLVVLFITIIQSQSAFFCFLNFFFYCIFYILSKSKLQRYQATVREAGVLALALAAAIPDQVLRICPPSPSTSGGGVIQPIHLQVYQFQRWAPNSHVRDGTGQEVRLQAQGDQADVSQPRKIRDCGSKAGRQTNQGKRKKVAKR
jgi:hypothetical protein